MVDCKKLNDELGKLEKEYQVLSEIVENFDKCYSIKFTEN